MSFEILSEMSTPVNVVKPELSPEEPLSELQCKPSSSKEEPEMLLSVVKSVAKMSEITAVTSSIKDDIPEAPTTDENEDPIFSCRFT